MVKLISATVALAVSTGCATMVFPDGSRKTVLLPQVATVVTIHNDCAPVIDIHGSEGLLMSGVKYGHSVTLPIVSDAFSGDSRSSFLTVKGFVEAEKKREYLGSITRDFYVSIHQGTKRVHWTIDHLQLPGGRGGCR